MTESDPQET